MRNLLILLTILAGCATMTRIVQDDQVAGWVGKPRDALIKAHGAPNAETGLASGDSVLTYAVTLDRQYPDCRVAFTVSRGMIREWSKSRCPMYLHWE